MYGDLYIRSDKPTDVRLLTEEVFRVLKVPIAGTRFSDNSPTGQYVYAECLGLRIKIEGVDDIDFAEYDFFLTFRPLTAPLPKDPHCLDFLAEFVARCLARAGFTVARP